MTEAVPRSVQWAGVEVEKPAVTNGLIDLEDSAEVCLVFFSFKSITVESKDLSDALSGLCFLAVSATRPAKCSESPLACVEGSGECLRDTASFKAASSNSQQSLTALFCLFHVLRQTKVGKGGRMEG